ncbi:male sterility protein-domain-containing protein [Mycena metata]|uniref:Male sterility protein-domain-containing protein n=1 Tax=Mycena metata TaxID=1033252 RepID=A0AAD7MTW4_9AGAR|nr:male sterility protein-domain-containing protein [Mycena metata]
MSTMQAISLCASSERPKRLVFISSTSVLDTPFYQSPENQPVSETDELDGAREGLPNGYSQTKWVAEQILREAGRRGLDGCVVRSCYVVGDRGTGACNTDDFIWRVVKASVELGCAPLLEGAGLELNAVPVGDIARIVAKVSGASGGGMMTTVNVTAPTLPSFNAIHASLQPTIPMVPYAEWLARLKERKTKTALAPLLHLIFAGILQQKSVRLGCANLRAVMGSEEEMDTLSVTPESIKVYLEWLKGVGWLDGGEESDMQTGGFFGRSRK